MRYLMRVGPLEFKDGARSYAYLSLGDRGLDTAFAGSDQAGLAELLRTHREETVCEPALARAAGKLGLRVERPPEGALALKAGFAVMLAHGTLLKLDNLELVIELVVAFVAFMRAAPWTVLEADEALEVELQRPARTFEGCVMGQGGAEFGLALYHQPGSIQRMHQLADAGHPPGELMPPCTSVLAREEPDYVIDAVRDLTGLGVAPALLQFRRGGEAPLGEGDVAALVASLKAVVGLTAGAPGLGAAETARAKVTAKVTRPTALPPPEAGLDFRGVGRNELCPCGSGKKYKRCHLGEEPPAGPGASWHERDHVLIDRLVAFSRRRFPAEAMGRFGPEAFGAREGQVGLAGPLASYAWPVLGRTLVAHFLEAEGASLQPADRQWLQAQQAAHLGVWEVLRVEPGDGLELLDLLSGERHFVREEKGSRTLVARDVLLARVVRAPDMVLLGGAHDAPLPPREADAVVRRMKAEGTQTGWESTVRLLELWDQAVGQRALELASPTRVRNTDGHEVVMVTDAFALQKGAMPSALSRLAGLQGADVTGQDASGTDLTFTRPGNAAHASWKNTILGSVRLTRTKLVARTNSRQRADDLRQRLLEALAGLATHRKRTEEALPPARGGQDLLLDAQQVATTRMDDLYRGWLDSEVRELGGRTPRVAVEDPEAVPTLHLLLKEMENLAARAPGQPGHDAVRFRRELGLDEVGARRANHRLDRATGLGRKMSETLLDFAQPVLEGPEPLGERDLEAALEFATLVWNAVVAEEQGAASDTVAAMRAELGPGRFPAALLRCFDALVRRKRDRFAGDLRMVGNWKLTRSRGRISVFMEARLSPELAAEAMAAGFARPG